MSAFDRSSRLQQELPDLLTDIAAPHVPDYTADLLALTAATRQRPRWTFLERWLPMGVIARRTPFFPAVPWRTIVLAAVLVALVAAALFVVGSQRRVPPPFGLARNGALVFDTGGDIYLRDSIDGTSRPLVTGPTHDFAAGFTRDGTRLSFLRLAAGSEGSPDERIQLFIANADGSDPRSLAGSLIAPDWFDWSTDDATLVAQADGASSHLYVIDVKAATQRRLDLGTDMLAANFPNFLGPDGREIVFRGKFLTKDAGSKSGIFAVHPDGTGLRAVTPTDGDVDAGYLFPQSSPDGRYVAYTVWDSTTERNRMHLLDLTRGADRTLDLSGGGSEGFATFSPDSGRILFLTYVGGRAGISVSPVDGSSRLAMGPLYLNVDGQYLTGTFSPDGTSVIVNNPATKETRIVDAATGGDGRILPWAADGGTAWQRLAP
jgi:Tol biopolymer transport system component